MSEITLNRNHCPIVLATKSVYVLTFLMLGKEPSCTELLACTYVMLPTWRVLHLSLSLSL